MLREAATIIGVTAATLRQQIAKGQFKASKAGRDWSVTMREVERYGRDNARRKTEGGPSGPGRKSENLDSLGLGAVGKGPAAP